MKLLPQSFTSFRMNSIYIRIFFSIMGLVLASVLIVACLSYWNSTKMMISEVKSNNMLILEQAQESIDREIKSIESSTMQAALDRRLLKALYISRQDSYYEAEIYRDIITYLNSIKANNDYITDLWVYFNKADIVLGSEGKYDSKLFFSNVCKYYSNIDWKNVFQKNTGFRSAGRQEVEYDLNRTPVVVFIKSMPINEFTPKGTLVVNLSEQFFYNKMGGNKDGKVVINYVVDSHKNIIFTNEKFYQENQDQKLARSVLDNSVNSMGSDEGTFDTKFDGKPYTIQYIKSRANDWNYISITPTGYISEKANGIRNVTIWVALISMILSIILAYFLVKRLYRPINDILNYISIMNNKKLDKQTEDSKDELKFINRIISFVYNENENLRDSFNKSQPILREKFLNDIANGSVTQERYKEIGSDIGIDMPFPLFQVIVFEIDEYVPEVLKRYRKPSDFIPKMYEIAGDALNENARCYSIQKDENILVSIINSNESFYESEGINEYLNKVRDYFKFNHELTFTIGVGRRYTSIEECPMSFIEALHALKYKIVKGQNTVIYIDEVKNISGNIFEYPIEKEKQLVTILKSGDIVATNQILLQIFTDNLDKRPMTPEMINNLFSALVGTAIRSIYEMQATITRIFGEEADIYAGMAEKSIVEEKKSYIYFIFKSIAMYAGDRKLSQNTKVYDKINAFVAENYNKELSLEKAAEVVNLSPSYLSFIFKEISGKNFVDFINEFRLEKAKELLTSTSMSVAQVAETVGYINANSFSKTFKKYIGVSPGQFRGM